METVQRNRDNLREKIRCLRRELLSGRAARRDEREEIDYGAVNLDSPVLGPSRELSLDRSISCEVGNIPLAYPPLRMSLEGFRCAKKTSG